MIRGISFDLFDTLVDQNPDRLAPAEIDGKRVSPTTPDLHRYVQDEAGHSISLSEFATTLRDSDRRLFRETLAQGFELPTLRRFRVLAEVLGLEDSAQHAERLTAIHMGILRDAVSVPVHHESVLASLAVEQRLALCSNFSHGDTARAILDAAGFSTHLSAVVVSDEVGIRKPRPGIFQAVLDRLDFRPEEILHVGDNLDADIAGAAACGMRTVWLTRRVGDPDAALEKYSGPRPDFALEDLLDLPVLVARLSV